MAEVVPNRAFEQISPQTGESLRRQEMIEKDNPCSICLELPGKSVTAQLPVDSAIGDLCCGEDMDRSIVVVPEPVELMAGETCNVFRHVLCHLRVCSRQRREAQTIVATLGQESELGGVVQELAASGGRQRLTCYARAVIAATQFVRAGKMVQRATSFTFCQPKETERSVAVIVPWFDRARATEVRNGFASAAESLKRDGAVVMGRCVPWLGRNGVIKVTDCRKVLAPGGSDDAQIVSGDCMPRRNVERRAIGGLGFAKTARLVMSHRACEKLVELGLCAIRHVPTNSFT